MKVSIMSKNGLKLVEVNRRKAIRERCLNCHGWYPREVEKCSFTDCTLYPFRAGKGKQDAKKREEAIREYCISCMAGNVKEVPKCASTDCSLFPYRMTRIDRGVEIIERDLAESKDVVNL